MTHGKLFALSDQHVVHEEDQRITESLRPESDEDWLLVAGDVGEKFEDVSRALKLLADRFSQVVRSPGNHELRTHPADPVQLHGTACYDALIEQCGGLGVRNAWGLARAVLTEERPAAADSQHSTILVTHYPLVHEPTRILRYPEFAQWCGTELTADRHRRFRAVAAVYSPLHIPRATWHNGVRFEEMSIGYAREWRPRPSRPAAARAV